MVFAFYDCPKSSTNKIIRLMQRIYMMLLVAMLGFTTTTYAAAAAAAKMASSHEETQAEMAANEAKDNWDNMSRKEKRIERKRIKNEIKQAIKEHKAQGAATDTLLLVIIAILLPPLAMALYDGLTNRFWLSLLLTLLFYLPGLIYTLVIILGGK